MDLLIKTATRQPQNAGSREVGGPFYAAVLAALFFLALLAGSRTAPFTPGFKLVGVTYLSICTAVPWLRVRLTIAWRIAGLALSFALVLGVLLWSLSPKAIPANTATAIPLILGGHLLLLSALFSDMRMKTVSLAQHLSVTYAALMWSYLRTTGIASDFESSARASHDAQFLFWPPFLSAVLWAGSQLVKRSVMTQLFLAIVLTQPAIGFGDLEAIWHVSWAYAAGVACIVSGFVCGISALMVEKSERAKKIASRGDG